MYLFFPDEALLTILVLDHSFINYKKTEFMIARQQHFDPMQSAQIQR